MPTIIDNATGEVLEEIPYDANQDAAVQAALSANPNATVSNDAMYRSAQTWDDNAVKSPVEAPVEAEGGDVADNPISNPYEEMTKGY
jgi:hypothetical protein